MPDSKLTQVFAELGAIMASEREKMGFVWLGSVEEDPRSAGGNRIMWGRKPNNDLYVLDLESDPGWEPIADGQWDNIYPHAGHPPHLPEGAIKL